MFCSILVILLNIFYLSPPSGNGNIIVEISGIKPLKGDLYIALYNSSSSFLILDSACQKIQVPVTDDTVAIVFSNVENGKYAIAVYHDENGNAEMDRHLNGIPKEGYGFSNNAKGKFGPPEFNDAKFTFSGSYTARIEIVNNIFGNGKHKKK